MKSDLATLLFAALAVVTLALVAEQRARPTASAPSAPGSTRAAVAVPIVTAAAEAPPLAMPAGPASAHLAAIPDRLLNDPPEARLVAPLRVRGTVGLGALDAPAEISWSEGGYFYWLRSDTLSVAQLVELASTLR